MLPMIDDNVFNPDLGAKLQAALQRLRSDGFGDGTQLSFSIYSIHQLPKLNLCVRSAACTVIFVGSDAPDLPSGFVNAAFAHMAGSSPAVAESCAYINPAEDGGYVLLGRTCTCAVTCFRMFVQSITGP